MNYLKQINGFWIWRKLNTISHAQMDLYFALLDCANTALWRQDFRVPNSTLMNLCHLSKSQLCNTRNQLIQLGLIGYTPGRRGQAGRYRISPLYRTNFDTNLETNSETNSETLFGNINKEKEKEKEKYKLSYRKNVFLTEEEYSELLKRYGRDKTDLILDKLDSYKAESGKEYRSDFAAIKHWVAASVEEKSGKEDVFRDEYNHENLEKLTRKPFFDKEENIDGRLSAKEK